MPVEGPVVKLFARYNLAGNVFGWQHHFKVNVPFTDFAVFAADLVANFNAAVNSVIFENVSNQVFAEDIEVSQVDPPDITVFSGLHAPLTQGQWDNVAGPLQVCGIIRWRTLNTGRSGRGRTHISGFGRSGMTAYGLPTSTHEILDLYGTAMMDTFGPVGTFNAATLVVLSRTHNGEGVDPPLAQPVVSYDVNPDLRTLRKRAGSIAF